MMDANSNSNSSSSSCSSSSTAAIGLDLYGKRRQLIKIQILEREIGLLQEELKSVDELQPASTCCKEVDEFVAAKVDPLLTLNEETHESNLCWKKLCYPWIWCIRGCFTLPKSSCSWCSQSCESKTNPGSRCMKRMGCKCNCGVSCPACCCFSSSSCKCKNLCCNCSIPCCCLSF